jgi:N6-adenosine-specific RNA methylase IME4
MTEYQTILADPPWLETGAGRIKRGADRHYSLMKTDEIIQYMSRLPIAENAHLYLWVTNNHLPDGLKVMNALGFSYKHKLVWVKDRIGLGQYFRGQHEDILFGVRGHLPYKNSIGAKRSICTTPDVIFAKRTEHSKKPDELYPIIELTSYPPYLEVFARRRRIGWDAEGDQLEQSTQLQLETV